MQWNWVDAIILFVFAYQVYSGWKYGSLSLLANLGALSGSLWLAIRFHTVVGKFIGEKFGLSATWMEVAGYAAIAFASQFILEAVFLYGVNKLPKKYRESKTNRGLGAALSVVNAGILIAFFVLLILALPLRGTFRQDVKNSRLSQLFVSLSERYGGNMKSSVGELANKATKFFTVEPNSVEVVPLDLPLRGMSYSIDHETEERMIILVNNERRSRGIPIVVADEAMANVAREKSRDMFERRYFSHYDPEGKNAADRMNKAGIRYGFLGENLAYAPDLTSAHDGLMNSEGHRKNILEARFRRIGIGVIDGGAYGKMFTQEFAD